MIKSQLVREKPIKPAVHCLRTVYAGGHIRPEKREIILELYHFSPQKCVLEIPPTDYKDAQFAWPDLQ